MPAAAYRASMPPPACSPGATTGVSGGGGDPRCALVVEVEAVELNLFIELGLWTFKPAGVAEMPDDDAPGGGQYC